MSVSALYPNRSRANWCTNQGLRCRLDNFSREIGGSFSGIAVRIFPQRFETYLNSHCSGGANRNWTEASSICGNPLLGEILRDITFVGPLATRMIALPQNGMRLVYDCEGPHLQVSLELIQNETGLATFMEILDGLIQKTVLAGSMRYFSALLEARARNTHYSCGGSYVPAVSYLFQRDRRNGRYISSEGVTFFPVGTPIAVERSTDRQMPLSAITQSCIGDSRPVTRHPSSTTQASLEGVSGGSNSGALTTGSAATSAIPSISSFTTSRGEHFQSNSLTDYMTFHENLDLLYEAVDRECRGTSPDAHQRCQAALTPYNQYSRSGHFSRTDRELHERDLLAMARINRDTKGALEHEWRADLTRFVFTPSSDATRSDVGYQSMTAPTQALARQWSERCTTSPRLPRTS